MESDVLKKFESKLFELCSRNRAALHKNIVYLPNALSNHKI